MAPIAYTRFNLVALLIARIFNMKWAMPLLFANSFAIFTSFHTGLLLDKTAYQRLLIWTEFTDVKFHTYNFIVHILPAIYTFMESRYNQDAIKPWTIMIFNPGLISMLIHFGWAIFYVGSFDLSHVYIPMDPNDWRVMWSVAAVSHILAQNLVYF